MNISSVSQLSAPPVDPTENQSEAETIRTDFLNLLIAQIQHQDPLDPQDPSEFTAQLTQFTSLEQLIGINESIQEQSELQVLSIGANAASLVGKTAEVLGSNFGVNDGEADKILFDQFSSSASTEVRVFNSAGQLVHVENMGSLPAGSHEYVWDGKNSIGTQFPDGDYSYEVESLDLSGNAVQITPLVVGRVTGIRFSGSKVSVVVGGQEHSMSSISSILESKESIGSATKTAVEENSSDLI